MVNFQLSQNVRKKGGRGRANTYLCARLMTQRNYRGKRSTQYYDKAALRYRTRSPRRFPRPRLRKTEH